MESKALQSIKDYRKQVLVDLYNEYTEAQRRLFDKMYGGVDKITDSRIDWAIQQCENTIRKTERAKTNG